MPTTPVAAARVAADRHLRVAAITMSGPYLARLTDRALIVEPLLFVPVHGDPVRAWA